MERHKLEYVSVLEIDQVYQLGVVHKGVTIPLNGFDRGIPACLLGTDRIIAMPLAQETIGPCLEFEIAAHGSGLRCPRVPDAHIEVDPGKITLKGIDRLKHRTLSTPPARQLARRAPQLAAVLGRPACRPRCERLMRFLFVKPALCLQLPSDSTSRWTPLPFGYCLLVPVP